GGRERGGRRTRTSAGAWTSRRSRCQSETARAAADRSSHPRTAARTPARPRISATAAPLTPDCRCRDTLSETHTRDRRCRATRTEAGEAPHGRRHPRPSADPAPEARGDRRKAARLRLVSRFGPIGFINAGAAPGRDERRASLQFWRRACTLDAPNTIWRTQ